MTHILNWMHPDVTAILEIVQKFANKQICATGVFVYAQIMPLTFQKEDAILESEVSYVFCTFNMKSLISLFSAKLELF